MSGYLLDTQVFLWMATANSRLPEKVRLQLTSLEVDLNLSIASAWEIAIKSSAGKLDVGRPMRELIGVEALEAHGINCLPITPEEVQICASLPFPSSGHRDPFDRMLVVQAKYHDLTLVTSDIALQAYDVNLLLA